MLCLKVKKNTSIGKQVFYWTDLKRNANSRMVFKLEMELSEVKQKLVNGSRKNQIYFSIEELLSTSSMP